jgi:hypothetical protein
MLLTFSQRPCLILCVIGTPRSDIMRLFYCLSSEGVPFYERPIIPAYTAVSRLAGIHIQGSVTR